MRTVIRTIGQLKDAIASLPEHLPVFVQDVEQDATLVGTELAYYPPVPGNSGFLIIEPDDEQ